MSHSEIMRHFGFNTLEEIAREMAKRCVENDPKEAVRWMVAVGHIAPPRSWYRILEFGYGVAA